MTYFDEHFVEQSNHYYSKVEKGRNGLNFGQSPQTGLDAQKPTWFDEFSNLSSFSHKGWQSQNSSSIWPLSLHQLILGLFHAVLAIDRAQINAQIIVMVGRGLWTTMKTHEVQDQLLNKVHGRRRGRYCDVLGS